MSKKNPLAYNRVIDKIRIPEHLQKTKKIMDKDRHIIRKLYYTGNYTYRGLAAIYRVSFGVIQCIINEDTRLNNLRLAREYRKRHNIQSDDAMQIRRRKKRLIQSGLITIQTTAKINILENYNLKLKK